MKFAIIALVGGASALKAYTDAADCTATTEPGQVVCFGTGKTYSATGGNQAWCARLTRGQKSQASADVAAKQINIVSGDFGGVYDTKTTAGKAVWKGALTVTDAFGSSCGFLGNTDGTKCGGSGTPAGIFATTTPFAAGKGYQAWTATPSGTSPAKMDITSKNGAAPLWGALLCPQAKDLCGTAWGDAKVKDFTAASAAAVDVKLGALDDTTACSYVIRAKCEAPFMHLNAGTSAQEDKVTWTILEYSASVKQGLIGSTDAGTINEVTSPAQSTGLVTSTSIQYLPKESGTAGENAGAAIGAVGEQGLNVAGFPKVSHVRFKGDASPVPVDSYVLFEAIAAKNAEYAAYSTAKAAYDTKRSDYDTKLAAAQVILDAQKKDIFKAWFPTEADKTALAAVPKSPIGEKPALPAAYTGPVAVFAQLAADIATKQEAGVTNTATAAVSAAWQASAPLGTYLDADGGTTAPSARNLLAGKSWGTTGYGTSDRCDQSPTTLPATCPARAAAGSMAGVGIRFARTDLAATNAACPETYMAVQVGVQTHALAITADTVSFKAGIKPYKWTLDAPVAPAAALDPKTPAGAKMLSLGAAALFATMTLF